MCILCGTTGSPETTALTSYEHRPKKLSTDAGWQIEHIRNMAQEKQVNVLQKRYVPSSVFSILYLSFVVA